MLASVQHACDRSLAFLHKIAWLGPLIVRLTLGFVFVTTGWGKLGNIEQVSQFFASLHIPFPHANAIFIGMVELAGGVALLLGLGTRIASLFLACTMIVAIWTAKLPELHGIRDLAATDEMAYLAAFVWLLVAGAGAASVDRLVARAMHKRNHRPHAV